MTVSLLHPYRAGELVDVLTIEVGDRIVHHRGVAVVLREVEETIETVGPLRGAPLWRFWCRGESGEAEGRESYMSYGRGAEARVVR